MNRKDRAKQFMPFDALKGFREALRMKEFEQEIVHKRDITEERAKKLSQTILSVKKNQKVEITFFENGVYITKQGNAFVNFFENYILLDETKILFENIFDIKVL